MSDIMIVGIAGGTGSGKTTITNQIKERLGEQVCVIMHDCYYRAQHELSLAQRAQVNYDHPDAYETELLVEHLAALRQGQAVEVPVYDFALSDRSEATTTVRPARVIIVEGIVILAHPALRELLDLKVYVDCDADVRILRRVRRDVRERGRSIESVIDQYLATVKPMHEAFVEPSKRHADLIIPTGGENPAGVEVLISHIRAHLAS